MGALDELAAQMDPANPWSFPDATKYDRITIAQWLDENVTERAAYHILAAQFTIAGRLRAFRYEIRCCPEGRIPDAEEAVESPRRLTADPSVARRVLSLVDQVPIAVWGRDELGAGEMWNSNSLTSWLLVRAGLDLTEVRPPTGGRAPGWGAGTTVARRPGAPRSA